MAFTSQLERLFHICRPASIWHTLIIIFVTYAMMPMALAWCFMCTLASSILDLIYHLALVVTSGSRKEKPTFELTRVGLGSELMALVARASLYLAVNLICLYNKYLIDLAQRNAFLETRRSIETRAKIERENDKQERLLLSLLPRFVALEIIADIARADNQEKLLKNQFHKIYIHSYSNVR